MNKTREREEKRREVSQLFHQNFFSNKVCKNTFYFTNFIRKDKKKQGVELIYKNKKSDVGKKKKNRSTNCCCPQEFSHGDNLNERYGVEFICKTQDGLMFMIYDMKLRLLTLRRQLFNFKLYFLKIVGIVIWSGSVTRN